TKPVLEVLPLSQKFTISTIISSSDSGFVLIGVQSEIDPTHAMQYSVGNISVIKTDKKGNTQWKQEVVEIDDYSTVVSGIRVVEVDDGFIACGIGCGSLLEDSDGAYNICYNTKSWVKKYSYTGTEIWSKVIDEFEVNDMIATSTGVVLTGIVDTTMAHGGFLTVLAKQSSITAMPHEPVFFISMIKIDADDGAIMLEKLQYTGSRDSRGSTVREIDSTFIFACYMHDTIMPYVKVINTTQNGDTIWSKIYGVYVDGVDIDKINATNPVAQPLSNGDLVVFANNSLYYYSDEVSFRKVYPTQSGKLLSSKNITVKENRISFTINKTSEVQAALYSVNGKTVYNLGKRVFQSGQNSFVIPSLSRGTYVLKLSHGRIETVQKTILLQ
ncbi:MAG: T9SS type A sorting domain-containing protein, partial [Fibrobacter sp.]|nr:T9SS type A sorting domain-containing protein [Fibrobacter sp.]